MLTDLSQEKNRRDDLNGWCISEYSSLDKCFPIALQKKAHVVDNKTPVESLWMSLMFPFRIIIFGWPHCYEHRNQGHHMYEEVAINYFEAIKL